MDVGMRSYWARLYWWQMARKAEPKNDATTHAADCGEPRGRAAAVPITLHNSPNFHVSVSGTNGFTAWGVHLVTPTDKKNDARIRMIDPGARRI